MTPLPCLCGNPPQIRKNIGDFYVECASDKNNWCVVTIPAATECRAVEIWNEVIREHKLRKCCQMLAEELRAKRAFGWVIPESPALRMWEEMQRTLK